MSLKNAFIFFVAAPLSLLGCSHSDSADTAPLPVADTATKVSRATQSVETSSMTPEQKRAAENYLQQGAAGAEQQKKAAQQSGAPK